MRSGAPQAHGSLLANDTNNGIEYGSDLHPGSLQGNTSALDRLGKALDPLHRDGLLLCEIIPGCTPYFIRQPSDDRYGLELFRRASLQHDQDAWDWLQHCYSESVLNWIHRHPRRELAYRFDSEKNYIAQAFVRFWFATAHNQKLEFNTLSPALQYCVCV